MLDHVHRAGGHRLRGGGRPLRAGVYLAHSEQIAGAFFPQGGWQASLDEARGRVALAAGDVVAGVRLITAARDTFERLGQHLDAVRCRDRLEAVIQHREGLRKVPPVRSR